MLAHIVGVPVEEVLPWTIPLVGLAFGSAVALARSFATTHWRKVHRSRARRGVA